MRPSRAQVEAAIGVIMRVPGLFIIDYWWQHDRVKSVPQTMSLTGLLNAILTNLILLHGFLLLLLPIPRVRFLYTHFVSALLLLSSHFISKYYIQVEASLVRRLEADPAFAHAAALVAHVVLAGLVFVLLDGPYRPFLPLLSCYTLPVVARILDFPVDVLEALHNFANALMCIGVVYYLYGQLPALVSLIKDTYVDTMLLTIRYGWLGLAALFWNRVFVPTHFLVFWLIGFAVKLTEGYPVREGPWYMLVLSSASAVCASPVTLVASSVTVAYLARLTIVGAQVLLHGTMAYPNDNPMHSGRTEGLTMLLLALQTGLTELHLPGRAAVLLVILFIVTSSLLQSVLEITEPVVLALSASQSHNVSRHVRVLITCVFLVTFPIWLALQLAALFPVDFWMMIVLSSCVLTSVQMGGLLVVYGLSVYDVFRRTEPWESLDDVVYVTRALTKGLEFIVAVFVVGVGLWESTTDKRNWTNASILLVHCYVNVWQRVQAGWKSFVLRREALRKTKVLPEASAEELQRHNDICAICYSEMKAACRTGCQHFFHRNCLRKWLYIQDKCPLCHAAINVDGPAL
ncbi:RING finger protein 145-like [Ornithodoros turicata]|uniref:Putative e3 ubiquitin ligase n=1 Tax=Ornithodoros turicata TaxID=34597 RepID=A0A2R5LL01_9ACAR